ncbi:glutamine-hydrolyzing GMP synthase [Picrophilus oshimae]|uniref:glutamine-hydrolyzing GMP synthase n=1 Tax=Picrophilus oshimae TaxID=46632 RepID=UPI0009FE023F
MDPEKFIKDSVSFIEKNVKRGILACSGGQDSTLLAVISSMAKTDILTVFIDTGLLRNNDIKRIKEIFSSYNVNGRILDRSSLFISRLRNVTDPEEKRKIIGRTFIEVFEEEAKNYGAESLLQGTIAPDWIESGGGSRDTIKSHHNVGGLPEKMNLRLVEPLRDLYKDEVREVSRYLGLPEVQPFPGPGLAIRIIGEVTEEKLNILRRATDIVEYESSKLNDKPWQYFPVLLPVRTTGIHGDQRTYGLTIAIRFIDTIDGMSGTFSRPDWSVLENISNRITDEIPEINRVVYDITSKPPATIEWE